MIGSKIYKLAKEFWSFNRSITVEGVRKTLQVIKKYLPNLKLHSIPSGSSVFDWIIPKEWVVNEAYIVAPNGARICDFSKNNLHLLVYSMPFEGEMSLSELKEHQYTLPKQPNAIPYITSYYKEHWGFCLTQKQFNNLEDGKYYVRIDSKLFDGVLNFAELLIKGRSEDEVFISTHICHPSMANNELSGPTVVTYLVKWLLIKVSIIRLYHLA